MADIFISYAREDRDWVSRLAGSLEAAGWSVWWDRRIPAGQVFWKVIQRELATARCVLVVWSPAALNSDFVIEEASQGRNRNVLVPVFKEMVLPPLGFGGIHTANLSAWEGNSSDHDYQMLVEDVAALIGKSPNFLEERPAGTQGAGHTNPAGGQQTVGSPGEGKAPLPTNPDLDVTVEPASVAPHGSKAESPHQPAALVAHEAGAEPCRATALHASTRGEVPNQSQRYAFPGAERIRSWVRRHRPLAISSATALVGLVAMLIYQGQRPEPPALPVVEALAPSELTQPDPPAIVRQPEGQSIRIGDRATLTVEALGDPPFQYQWYKGSTGNTNTPVADATSADFATPPVLAAMEVWVRVRGGTGLVDSQTATVSVLDPTYGGSIGVDPEAFVFDQRNQETGLAEFVHKVTGIQFVLLPGGAFDMGSPETEVGRMSPESPLHQVVVGPFLMSKYEVTQEQWRKVMGINPSIHQGDDLPVENVSWHDCMEFCRKTGLALPTEAQWEYACRAGTKGAYGGTGILDEMGWYAGSKVFRPQPGGRKQPNHFGLYDMHGNVWEWTRSLYEPYPYQADDGREDVDADGFRVLRGGSFFSGAGSARCANRYRDYPDFRSYNLGFRVVASPF